MLDLNSKLCLVNTTTVITSKSCSNTVSLNFNYEQKTQFKSFNPSIEFMYNIISIYLNFINFKFLKYESKSDLAVLWLLDCSKAKVNQTREDIDVTSRDFCSSAIGSIKPFIFLMTAIPSGMRINITWLHASSNDSWEFVVKPYLGRLPFIQLSS